MDVLNELFGLHVETLQMHQMCIRGVIAFFVALLYIRIAGVRSLGTQSAFDQLTSLMLGAIMGRSVVSAQQPFFGSLVAVLVIMLLHRLLAWATYKSHWLGKLFKGEAILLIEEGKPVEVNLKKTHTTKEDIEEAQRLRMLKEGEGHIQKAYLERSGEISVIKRTLKD